jgi:tight adherence protein C
MQAMPTVATILLVAGAAGGAISLAILAAALLAHAAEDRDLVGRMRSVVRPVEQVEAVGPRPGLGAAFLRPVMRLGEMLRNSAFIGEKDILEFQKAVAAAGLDARRAVPAFIGAKAVLLVVLPLGSLGYVTALDIELTQGGMMVAGALFVAVFGPNLVVGMLRRPFQNKLRKGLPDALDLLVVAAEAGLGLETAVDRVAREMEGSNRAISLELAILVQELRMLPDRRMALERLGERTDIEGFKRLGATLSQTLRYGTPLAQALRVLSGEMRQERMLRIEEKAIRLPALLVGPLILFILPALFIALVGPSVLEMGKVLGGPQ